MEETELTGEQSAEVLAEQDEALSDEDFAAFAQLCKRRASTYSLLERLYRVEVDEETYAGLRSASFPARTENEDINKGYRLIAKYLSNGHDDPILDLARDFVRVFIGHGNTAYSCAYPFESVYTSEKRLLMQESRDEILALYRQAGLQLLPSWKDPEDHVALELEYMKILSEDAQKAFEEKREEDAQNLLEKQYLFLKEHLAAWAPMMTIDMRRFAATDFYMGLSYLTEGFLREDRKFLAGIFREETE